jgi:hypothetical protein
MKKDDTKIFLLNKLLQTGLIFKDIKLLLDLPRLATTDEMRDILSSPLYKLNISQVLAISKAIGKTPEYVMDAAQFGGKDLIQMDEKSYGAWIHRLGTEPLASDVRRNLAWAMGKGIDVQEMVLEYLDNHPEKRMRRIKISPYQYKLTNR